MVTIQRENLSRTRFNLNRSLLEKQRNRYKSFDQVWKIQGKEHSTFVEFKKLLKLSLFTPEQNNKLLSLAYNYRRIESQRWASHTTQEKPDIYHTHGMLSAYNALRAVNLAGDTLNEQDKFLVIAAAMLHDAGGSQKPGEGAASAKKDLVIKLLAASQFTEEEIKRVKELISYTNYGNSDNPAYTNFSDTVKFDAQNIPLAENIVIFSDLSQISAEDYWIQATTAGYANFVPPWLYGLTYVATVNLLQKVQQKKLSTIADILGDDPAHNFINALTKSASKK